MKTFKKFSKSLKEHALYKGDISYYDTYFEQIPDSKKTLKNFTVEIDKLKKMLSKINVDTILLDNSKYKDDKNYIIKFGINIDILIFSIKNFYNEIKDKNKLLFDKINDTLFFGEIMNLDFDVQIEKNNFNKFHFPIDLPAFLKNIGIGKKIIMKSLNEFNYCLFTYNDSFELKLSVHSISEDSKYFSFVKGKNILIFYDNFDIVKNILKQWFKLVYNEKCLLDEDFYVRYKEKIKDDDFLREIYKKYN